MPKDTDILLVSSKTFIWRAITLLTWSKRTHAWMFIEIRWEMFIIEAHKNWIQLSKWDDYKKPWRKYLIIENKREIDKKKYVDLVVPMCWTKRYDFMSLFIYRPIYIFTKKRLGKKEKWDNVFYCSEFVAYTYHKLYGIFPERYKTAPQDLYDKFAK